MSDLHLLTFWWIHSVYKPKFGLNGWAVTFSLTSNITAQSIDTYLFGARELDVSIYPWFALSYVVFFFLFVTALCENIHSICSKFQSEIRFKEGSGEASNGRLPPEDPTQNASYTGRGNDLPLPDGWGYAKRSLMSWVVVRPSFGMKPTFPKKKKKFKKKSRCHTKRRAGAAPCARPSFGMTPTQAIRDLFAWRHPDCFIKQFNFQSDYYPTIIRSQEINCISGVGKWAFV